MASWRKTLAAAGLILVTGTSWAADKLTVYSYRQAFLVDPILEDFTKQTGIDVEVVFAKKGIAERLKREGRLSPADIVLTSDFSRLMELVDMKLVQSVNSDVVNQNIPAQFRDPDGQWFALTSRVRNVYSSKERVGPAAIDYEDLAKPEFKGKICMRPGQHPYNVSLVASMIAHHGEADTEAWLQGLKANLARKPQGNDRAQVKAVKEGLCDYAIGNSYYLGKMMENPDQQAWADAVVINFPNQSNRGAHVNVSGVAMTKYSPNSEAAVKLIEFLSSSSAQQQYAEVNFEYPVKTDVPASAMVASWGEFKADDLAIVKLAEHHSQAVKLLNKVKFDL
ncbi:Fe(3+) ABC transporter substrate-binding protein [Paraferrimonas sedimenticola]|uniref:Iron ABC transporter substrate-binding protein n=1 Tax=Paraferrimonas sedimenticola TaxID=375674 RepID=A0AA37VZ28_9GAMM|nr:Fe(3+) ABC transporter substrate-binding protein [Paraferrimonas sedimenticola]GLP97361.1 iron ABC transporter substrate-binding protein [Paraferrimonas sedimenticola]